MKRDCAWSRRPAISTPQPGAAIMTIRVLICDDSAVMRGLLTQIIDSDPRLEVVGVAADPLVARDLIKSLDPDVLTLDVEMPRMGGIEFLERLMRLRPMPVVMISSFTERGSEATLRALELGAVDFLAKPGSSLQIGEQAREIREKIIAAFHARKRLAMHMPARPEASAGGVRALRCRSACCAKGRPHRCLDGRDRGDQGGAVAPSRGLPALDAGPAHAGDVHCVLRPPDGQPLRPACQGRPSTASGSWQALPTSRRATRT